MTKVPVRLPGMAKDRQEYVNILQKWLADSCRGKTRIETIAAENGIAFKSKIAVVCERDEDATLVALKWT